MVETIVYFVVAGAGVLFGVGSAVHALLHKRDPRSQLNWLIICMLLPVIGGMAYWLLGVNRIRTRARKWQSRGHFDVSSSMSSELRRYQAAGTLAAKNPKMAESLTSLLQISMRVTGKPLLVGNKVEALFNGEQAYPAMIEAIRDAKEYVYLCTYLFDTDQAGLDFIDALGEAAARGVDVRVMVDALGERYARPRATKLLRRKPGVKVARFLPLAFSLRGLRINLRNHRKLIVVDGRIGFTGGMNIGQRHMVEDPKNKKVTADVHFRITGPAVYALEEVFWEDWFFTTHDEDWQPKQTTEHVGEAMCRGIKDGPNEDFEKLQWILVGALTCARERVQIMTPYFIPGRELLAGLTAAVLRGTKVDIILPKKNNLPFVAWATQSMLWEVLQYGVRVYYQPPPFNHSKLLVVDGYYVNLGSANLDPRSLRLNFEFNLEVFDDALGGQMSEYIDKIRSTSEQVTQASLQNRSLPVRLRDSIAKLFSPYL